MLSKNFKSNKYYEVTRYWLKYGNEEMLGKDYNCMGLFRKSKSLY